MFDEGIYKVTILDNNSNQKFSFEVTLDKTPPTLDLIGVENGGKTKGNVKIKNISEKPFEIIITADGIPFEYKIGDDIERSGRFEIILKDEAGNFSKYAFEKEYGMNGASIAVISGLCALVVLLIALLIKSRHHFYKGKIIEEIEETTVIEDIDDKTDE